MRISTRINEMCSYLSNGKPEKKETVHLQLTAMTWMTKEENSSSLDSVEKRGS
jgi:hypothetical protein